MNASEKANISPLTHDGGLRVAHLLFLLFFENQRDNFLKVLQGFLYGISPCGRAFEGGAVGKIGFASISKLVFLYDDFKRVGLHQMCILS